LRTLKSDVWLKNEFEDLKRKKDNLTVFSKWISKFETSFGPLVWDSKTDTLTTSNLDPVVAGLKLKVVGGKCKKSIKLLGLVISISLIKNTIYIKGE
jgi:hypothetical protein